MSEVEAVFVFNEQRRQLFGVFVDFLKHIQKYQLNIFELWLDGSFATRKINPRDIDLVLFLDYNDYKTFETTLREVSILFAPMLDIYFVSVYPAEHSFFVRTQFDRVEYLHLFSKDRLKKKKGFVQLILDIYGKT
ncbi:MAG: hypothetical protein IPM98_00795 [Lewinellaceae bacterium]|nr:hypothetical protein [Lewinellaceae bacterium]